MGDAFLDGYSGQTTDELLALEQQYRVDSLVLAFEQAIQDKPPGSMSIEESYVLAVEGLEREVNNGGYSQFFGNSSGEFAPIIETALRAIDCPKTADITRDAVAALGVTGLTADAVAAAAYGEDELIRQALAACDARYFANDDCRSPVSLDCSEQGAHSDRRLLNASALTGFLSADPGSVRRVRPSSR